MASQLSEEAINNIQASPVTNEGGQGKETKEQALEKIKDINGNPENELNKALRDEEHPDHKKAVEERMRLYRIAYGEGAV